MDVSVYRIFQLINEVEMIKYECYHLQLLMYYSPWGHKELDNLATQHTCNGSMQSSYMPNKTKKPHPNQICLLMEVTLLRVKDT